MLVMTEEERRRLWEAGPTDVDGIGRKADVLIAETRRGGGRGAPAARRESDEFIHALHDDLKSSAEGKRLGREFSHCPYRLAAHLGITVQYVPLAQLQNSDRPLIMVTGGLWRIPGQPPIAQLADTLDPWESSKVLAHEIGHFLGFEDERLADQFSAAFMTFVDDSPAARWRKMKTDLENRARRDAITRGRALAATSRH